MFFEAMDLHRTLDLNSNLWTVPFENSFKRMINCPVTRANMNERSKHTTNWRYHCSVTYFTLQWQSSHDNFSFIVT